MTAAMTRAPLGIASLALLLVAAALSGAAGRAPDFPHERHEKLFPVCEGCHAGIPAGDASATYPTAESCARCHDGERRVKVPGPVAATRATNLRFSHAVHAASAARRGESLTCQRCHATVDGAPRMSVAAAKPDRCTGCHAHRAPEHLALSAECGRCHLALTQATALSEGRIAGFPQPSWHARPDFLSTHGADARERGASCAVCHARPSCERCHANAARVAEIAALGPDARVLRLVHEQPASYPRPASHRDAAWDRSHGARARTGIASCANCHTRPSCTGCHVTPAGASRDAIASLDAPGLHAGPGVPARRAAARLHPGDFLVRHRTAASTEPASCAQCHSERSCAGCHAGNDSRAFHAANFVERHATDVFAGSGSCQSCHDTEGICRDCHVRAGIASRPGMRSAFHTGQPMWVLSHGQAARTGMESCASCHRQADCTRCHSAVGGWRVNPHGPGFPASRLSARNAASCRWCHQ